MNWLSLTGFVDAIKESTDDRLVAHVRCLWTGQVFQIYIPDGLFIARKSNVVLSGYVKDGADFTDILEVSDLDISRVEEVDANALFDDAKVIDSIDAQIDEKDVHEYQATKTQDAPSVVAVIKQETKEDKQDDERVVQNEEVPNKPKEEVRTKTASTLEPVNDALVTLTRDALFTEKDPADEKKKAEESAKLALYRDKSAIFNAGQVFMLYGDDIDDEIDDAYNNTPIDEEKQEQKLSISGAKIAAITFQEMMRAAR